MKAIVVEEYGNVDVMKIVEKEALVPDDNQVVIELKAIGVNPVDTYVRSGIMPFISVPYTPGFDGSGIVKSIGKNVKNIQIGDRVFTAFNISGTYAEEVLCDVTQVLPLPDCSSFEEGAAIFIPYGTAYRALFECAKIESNETILIHGASGAVGIAAIQLAKAKGCTIIGSAGSEKGQQVVLEQGASFVVDHKNENHYKQIMDITNGKGVDVILEMVSDNIPLDMTIIKQFGRIAIIGGRDSNVDINPLHFTNTGISLIGVNIGHLSPSSMVSFSNMLSLGLTDGSLKPFIKERYTLKNAAKAHEEILKGGGYGKIVLIP